MGRRNSYTSSFLVKTWVRQGALRRAYISSEIMSCCNERPSAGSQAWSGAVRRQYGPSRHSQARAGPRGSPQPGSLHPPTDVGDQNQRQDGVINLRGPDGKQPAEEAVQGPRGSQSNLPCPPPALAGPSPLPFPSTDFPALHSSHKGIPFPILCNSSLPRFQACPGFFWVELQRNSSETVLSILVSGTQ